MWISPPFERQNNSTNNDRCLASSFVEEKMSLIAEPVETTEALTASQRPQLPDRMANSPESDDRGRVLMTGGTGFLGLHLLRGFLLSGREVTLLAHAGGLPTLERVRRFLVGSGDLKKLPRRLDDMVRVFGTDIALPMLGLAPSEVEAALDGVTEVWHVAATVMLDGRDELVWTTNVVGTENVLQLAERTPAHVPFRYISTAFVVGRTCDALVPEAKSGDATEFENVYERSKHAAEAVVRRWAAVGSRSALILRPSILVPGVGSLEGLPEHTMHTVSLVVAGITGRRSNLASRLPVRLGADPRAQLNVVQVDWAADAMLRIARKITSGVEAVHVVHDTNVPVRCISAALEDVSPIRMRMVPAKPADPTDSEKLFYRRMTGFLPYTYHRSRFDTTAMWKLLAGFPAPLPIGREHLRYCMQVSSLAANASVTNEADVCA